MLKLRTKIAKLILISLSLGTVSSISAATIAQAVDTPFTCSASFYQVTASNSGSIYASSVNTSGVLSYTRLGTGATSGINGAGYNTADNLIYGIASGSLIKIDAAGVFTNLGALVPSTLITGAPAGGDFIAPNRLLEVGAGTGGSASAFYLINTVTRAVTAIASTSGSANFPTGPGDFAFFGNYGWGLFGATLYRIDATNLIAGTSSAVTVASYAVTAGALASPDTSITLASGDAYGAAYADRAGNLYYYNNGTTHNVIKIPVASINGSPAPKSLLVGGQASPTALTAPNDGASCPTAPSPYDPPTPINDTYWMALGTTLTVNSANSLLVNDKSSGSAPYVVKSFTPAGGSTVSVQSTPATSTSMGSNNGTLANFANTGQFTYSGAAASGTQTFTYDLIETSSPSRTSATTASVTINIIDMPAQTPTSGTTGSPYSYQITSTGPTTGAVFSLTSSNATCLSAAGLSLSSSGLISGTPTASTSVSCSYQMTLNGVTVTRTFVISFTANSFTVTYDINGGTGTTPASQTTDASHNSVVLDPATGFSRNGYTFVSWLESATAQNTFLGGVTYTPTASVTMVAQWLAQSATLTYNLNGGTGTIAPCTYTYGGSACNINSGSSVTPPTGYTFLGWYTSATGGTPVTGTFTSTTSTIIYAQYSAIVYHVYYFGDSVTAGSAPATQNTSAQTPAIISGNTGPLTKASYTFAGWIETATSTTYNVGTTYRLLRNINLTAVWTQNHTITYDANGGTGSLPTGVSWSGTANQTIASPSGLSRAGFQLASWNTKPDGTGQTYSGGDIYSANGNLTLYAVWIPISYVVTYDANGGANNPGNQTFSVTSPDIIASGASLTRPGYTFAGWWTDNRSGSGAQYAPGTTYAAPADLQLFAQWVANSYHISYNGNGATSGHGPVAGDTTTFTYGSNPAILGNIGSPAWALTAAKFIGWNTKADGSGDSWVAGDVYSAPANLELYAIWIPLGTYVVSYDPNGGTGAPADQRFLAGGSVTIQDSSIITRYGYTFAGWWNDTSTVTGVTYLPGDSYSTQQDLTLFAVWIANEHEVTYDANGGIGITPLTQKFAAPSTVTISDTNTSSPIDLAGYLFDGWNTKADGTGTDYAVGDVYGADANLLLYATWTPEEYVITYDSNGGTGFIDSETLTVEQPATINDPTGITGPAGATTFGGWNTAADGSGTSYEANDLYDLPSDLDLYAVWIPNASFVINYDANGGALAQGMSGTVIYTSSSNVVTDVPTRSGYNFAGWTTAANGGGTSYAAGATITGLNVTLYAQWTAIHYRIVYDANGGQGAPSSQTLTVATGALIKPTTGMTRTGYVIAGWWNSTSTATGSNYAPGDRYSQADDLTLYAIWVLDNFDITYDLNGGTGSAPQTATFTIDAPGTIGNGSALTRSGFHFGGWAEERTNPTHIYTYRDAFSEPRDLELFAIWVPDNEFIVTYDLNGALGTPPASQIFMGGTQVSILTVPVNPPGLAFISWNTNETGTGTDYLANALYGDEADLPLFALWSPIVYHVNYHANGGSGTAPAVQNFTVVHPANIQGQSLLAATGYRFDGWNTTADGSGVTYVHGDTYLEPADIDLYAIWTCATTCSPLNQNNTPSVGPVAPAPTYYRIVYLGNGGSGSVPASSTVVSGTTVVLLNPALLTYPGYIFQGWNTEANGSGNTYLPGTPYILGSNVNLYAIWKSNPVVAPATPAPSTVATPTPSPTPSASAAPLPTNSVQPGGVLTRVTGAKTVVPNQIVPVKDIINLETPGKVLEVTVNGAKVESKIWASGAITLTNLVGPKDVVKVVEMVNSKKETVVVHENNDPISLANVNFDTASYVLDAAAKAILDKVATVVKQHGFTTIELVGHTDTAGVSSGYDNQTLSRNRAIASMKYLQAKLGKAKVTITVDAKAHVDPVAANTTTAGRAANRRVEIVVH